MRKFQEIKGEEAIDVMVEVLEPISKIAKDKMVSNAIENGDYKNLSFIKKLLKKYKKEILEIMAIIDGKPYEEFIESFNLLTLPAMLTETFNDPDIMALFPSAEWSGDVNNSTSAMVSTEE